MSPGLTVLDVLQRLMVINANFLRVEMHMIAFFYVNTRYTLKAVEVNVGKDILVQDVHSNSKADVIWPHCDAFSMYRRFLPYTE